MFISEFIQIKKVLSYYYGMGLKNRHDAETEFFRSVKKKNFYQIPFIVLFKSSKDIFKSKIDIFKNKNFNIFIHLFC